MNRATSFFFDISKEYVLHFRIKPHITFSRILNINKNQQEPNEELNIELVTDDSNKNVEFKKKTKQNKKTRFNFHT